VDSVADDEVRISASLNDDMSAALLRIQQRIKAVEDELDKLNAKGKVAGDGPSASFENLGSAAEDAGRKAKSAIPSIKSVGDEANKAGKKADQSSGGFRKFANEAAAAKKRTFELAGVMKILKFAGLITGGYALAGGLSALAAGAIIAVGGLSQMVGVAAGVGAIFAGVKLSMLAVKLAGDTLKPTLDGITNQFTALGPVIARGGLQSGLQVLSKSLGGLTKVTGTGLAGLGAELGFAARSTAALVKSAPLLNQISRIFSGLDPIVGMLSQSVILLGLSLINVLEAALPSGKDMALMFWQISDAINQWTSAQLASGKLSAMITKSWDVLRRTVGVLVDVVIGLFRIFLIGTGYVSDMGLSIEAAAAKFRSWTGTAEGQARINKYFQDSLPALQEMGKLLSTVGMGLAHLGGNANVAPLLSQINTELLPSLMLLVNHLTGQAGLGPALIHAASALAQLFAGLDFNSITLFVQGLSAIVNGIVWLTQNVPGANVVVSSLLFSLLGFKVMGAVWGIIGEGAKAYIWVSNAKNGVEDLSNAQKLLGPGFGMVVEGLKSIQVSVAAYAIPAIQDFVIAGITGLGELSAALFATPVGWIILGILAIVAIVVLLWTKCAWFRDGVKSVWDAIKTAGLAAWNAIKIAAIAVFNALKTAWEAVASAMVTAWNAVSSAVLTAWNAVGDALTTAWEAIKTAWKAAVDFIIMVGMWIWDHGLKQVVSIIVTVFKATFTVVKFIVQTAVFIIVGIITLIAIGLKAVFVTVYQAIKYIFDVIVSDAKFIWGLIVKIATAAWQNIVGAVTSAWNSISAIATAVWVGVIKPIIQGIVDFFTSAWNNITSAARDAWNAIVAGVTAFWNEHILPIINDFKIAWNTAWAMVSAAAAEVWSYIQQKAQAFWDFASPFFNAIGTAGSAVWNFIKDAASSLWTGLQDGWSTVWGVLSGIWSKLQSAGTGVWDAIKSAASSVGDTISGVWDAITGGVKSVWNFIARGWNSIPSFTVPDWIPGIGGKTFGLPKLPLLFSGGEVPGGGPAIVGEHGPEPLIQNGRFAGMLGMNGPEIANIPKGGYVVPNLSTLSALPGLAKSLPAGVASAVARSVPGYAPVAKGSSGNAALAREVRALAGAVATASPPIYATSSNVRKEVESALRTIRREDNLRSKYYYGGA
jgi:phage-related protein